jgi:DNA-binding NtrC family response regulator
MVTTLNCLIIEDDSLSRVTLEAMLQNWGYEASSAPDAATAKKMISEHHYHVVVSDVRLPDSDGLILYQHIAANSPETKVILVTGYATVAAAVAAIKAGVYEYLVKPIVASELNEYLQVILGNLMEMPLEVSEIVLPPALSSSAEKNERESILSALEYTNGQRKKCAQALGISRRTLWLKLRKHGLSSWGR